MHGMHDGMVGQNACPKYWSLTFALMPENPQTCRENMNFRNYPRLRVPDDDLTRAGLWDCLAEGIMVMKEISDGMGSVSQLTRSAKVIGFD